MKSLFYDQAQVIDLYEKLIGEGYALTYDFDKHRFDVSKEGNDAGIFLRLPITIGYENDDFSNDKTITYIMVLVQSGSASIGVFEGEECLHHKVFGSYMVRKKQGKSQIKHLKTKGKSRAGSRVRLASTLEFFENINERLQAHFKDFQFDRIAISCSKILIPYLYNAKVATPFEKKDHRIYRIPKHLHQPNYEVMLGMQRYLNKAELVFDEQKNPELNDFHLC